MVQAVFTKEMKDILETMKGKTFCSYECHKTDATRIYGKCRLNMGTFAIDLYNYTQGLPFPGYFEEEDIAVFTCESVDKNSIFTPCEIGASSHIYLVGEKIKSVEVVNDTICIDDGEYEITMDQALIIKTNENVYSFYKDWMFSEIINVQADRNNPVIYDVENVKADWDDDGQSKVDIIRTTTFL